jgi:hypothetical protein
MKLVITYCSRPKVKDPGGLPAIERYQSARIDDLAELEDGFPLILSGEFGLLELDTYIPWYDHLLTGAEVPEMAVTVADQLLEFEPEEVEYRTADPEAYPEVGPYFHVMEKACRFAGVTMTVVKLEGNPE